MGIPLTLSSVPAVTPYIQYVATNGQTVFPYPFPITQDSDLVVVVNGITQATDAGYTLSGQGNPFGGNVTFALGRTSGDIVTLFRDIAIQRVTQIAQNSGFSSTAFNAEFNNIYLILQQLQEATSFCLQIPNTNTSNPPTTLTPASYANKYLAFDANGNPTAAALTSSGTITLALLASFLNLVQTVAEAAAGVVPVNLAYPPLTVDRYGTNTSPGVTDMSGAVANALAVAGQLNGATITFLDGYDYFLNLAATGPTGHTAVTLNGMSNIKFRGKARVLVNSPALSIPVIFLLQDCNNITFEDLRAYDNGANIAIDFQGAWFVYATTTTANDCGGIILRGCEVQNCIGAFTSVLTTGTGRVRGIHFEKLKLESCYYGPNFQNNGDAVTGSVICNNVRRAYFPYGVHGHNVSLDIWHDAVAPGANACIDIKRYTYDTGGLKIRASFHGSLAAYGSCVNFEPQMSTGFGSITALGAITGGTLYTGSIYTNVPLTGGTGTGATATIEVAGGAIVGCWLQNRGNGYVTTDTLSVSNANVGGAGSGFSIPVAAVGAVIEDIEIDLDLSDATFAPVNVPFQFRSFTQGGVLNATTTDLLDRISLRGNLGQWSFYGNPAFNIASVPTGIPPGRIAIASDLFGNFYNNPQVYPGFVIRTAADTEVYTEAGDLTATPISIPLDRYDARIWSLEITIHAEMDYALGNTSQSDYIYIVHGFKTAGSAPTVSSSTAVVSATSGTASVASFSGSGTNLNVAFTNYNLANSRLRMSVRHLSKFL